MLNQQELEDIKPYVDKAVQRHIGLREPTVVNAAISLLSSGADRNQIASKLRSLHPSLSEKAYKLTDNIIDIMTEYASSLEQHKQKAAKKRSNANETTDAKPQKQAKGGDEEDGLKPSPGQLSAMQIQQMMADAKRLISERKRDLEAK